MIDNVERPMALPGQKMVTHRGTSKSPKAWAALLWAEWYAHSQILLIFLAAWLVAVWTLPLFTHAAWVLVFGVLYALLAGPIYGGGDVLEGCEEFCFALPPTRAERFLARLTVGGGTVLLFCLMNLAALGLDLPQILAGLYVQSGILKPLPVLKPGLLYGLVGALPLAIFSFAFAISSATHSRMLIMLSWFWAVLASLALLQTAFWYEDLVWETLNGYFACPLLLTTSVAVLATSYWVFRQKEVGRPSTPVTLPGYWWLWAILFVLGLGLALALGSSLIQHFSRAFQA